MKFIHLSDLHLGKRMNEKSLSEDQTFILQKILAVLDEEKPDAVLIAGDIYDKAVPSAEAVSLFDAFLVDLNARQVPVFAISGNHDSAERIAFGSRIMDASGIHLSPIYRGSVTPISLTDEFGKVNVYMLPFVKPATVSSFFEDKEIKSYQDAVACAIESMGVNMQERNVLITHQFVTGASRSDSEEVSVGGTDNVDACVFESFDYVALGHLHNPQNCSSPRIRYCGSPLKYSFSEARSQKSVTVVELGEKGSEPTVRTVPLTPLHEVREVRGTFEEVSAPSYYEHTTLQEDYLHITLTDEDDVPEAMGRLGRIYHNLLKFDYDNTRTRTSAAITGAVEVQNKSPYELFCELYVLQNNQPLSEEQAAYVMQTIASVWEGEE